ncbi:MAG: hypothetical protein QG622_135 [Actinomycetota bacterium]|nr:hypothetical protein [Actinomycetota bacterium]
MPAAEGRARSDPALADGGRPRLGDPGDRGGPSAPGPGTGNGRATARGLTGQAGLGRVGQPGDRAPSESSSGLGPFNGPPADDGRPASNPGTTVLPALGRPSSVDPRPISNAASHRGEQSGDRTTSSRRSPDPAMPWPGADQHLAGDRFPFADPPGRGAVDPRVPIVPRPVQPLPLSGPITQPTIMLRPFDPPLPGPISPPETGREAFVDNPHEHSESQTPGPSLVRPYSRTGGRTKPGRDLALEALVSTTVSGRDAWQSPMLTPEHASVIELCSGTVSVAEIAARLAVPLGVARVIIADMVDLGLIEVMRTSSSTGDERDPAFLRRVLSGLQRL